MPLVTRAPLEGPLDPYPARGRRTLPQWDHGCAQQTAILNTDRYDNSNAGLGSNGGGFYYTIPGLVAGSTCTVTLFFIEGYWTVPWNGVAYGAGTVAGRAFNVQINGTQVLTNFDIWSTANILYGQGENCAIAEQYTATANSSGQVVINFVSVTQAVVAGIMVTGAYTANNNITSGPASPLTLNGTGINGSGALINSSTTAATYTGLITLGGASTIAASIGNITLSNPGTITGGYALTLGGSATGGTINSIIGTGAGSVTENAATGVPGRSPAPTLTPAARRSPPGH